MPSLQKTTKNNDIFRGFLCYWLYFFALLSPCMKGFINYVRISVFSFYFFLYNLNYFEFLFFISFYLHIYFLIVLFLLSLFLYFYFFNLSVQFLIYKYSFSNKYSIFLNYIYSILLFYIIIPILANSCLYIAF